jgi:hypothetical protein
MTTKDLARRIVRAAKKDGCTISVCGGGDEPDNDTQGENDIVEAMHACDEHHVTFHKDGLQRGWMLWLPDCDNSEVDEAICDYTASEFMYELLKEAGCDV